MAQSTSSSQLKRYSSGIGARSRLSRRGAGPRPPRRDRATIEEEALADDPIAGRSGQVHRDVQGVTAQLEQDPAAQALVVEIAPVGPAGPRAPGLAHDDARGPAQPSAGEERCTVRVVSNLRRMSPHPMRFAGNSETNSRCSATVRANGFSTNAAMPRLARRSR